MEKVFKRAEGILETVKVTSVNVSGTEYYTFTDSRGYQRMLRTDSERMIDPSDPAMWVHKCPREKDTLEVGVGEPCNWCGASEESSL